MRSSDLDLFRSYGRPAWGARGNVLAALSTPDVATDSYRGVIHLLRADADPLPFTRGPRDSAPVTSPGGEIVVFLRAAAEGPAQLYAMPLRGGEPFPLVSHPLGASDVTFSPDGRSIAYLAAVPEPGRYGTADGDPVWSPAGADQHSAGGARHSAGGARVTVSADGEPPRRVDRLAYRHDGKGFVIDKGQQIFILDLVDGSGAPLADSAPRQLTEEPGTLGRPAFTPDGQEVIYVRPVDLDSQQSHIAAVPVDAAAPGLGRTVLAPEGDAAAPIVADGTLYYIGTEFTGNDFAGRTPGLWSVPFAGGAPRRMTDPETVHVEAESGDPAVVDGMVLVAVADRGSVSLRAVPLAAEAVELGDLPALLGGPRVVKSFTERAGRVAAVVADSGSCGDVVIADLRSGAATLSAGASQRAVDATPGPAGALPGPAADVSEARLTDVSAPLRAAGLARVVEITGAAPDGYPVHGYLVLPPDSFSGPHPVLLDVHGGPHAAYTWGVFDEAQMYAAHGYAVVLPNPRGSAGYGQQHGRAIIGALGTVDADDVLALLDAALAREDLDAARVGVMGGSYGGFMTSWLASHAPDRFVAGISERAVNAWDSFTGSSDIGYFFADAYVGSDPDQQRARSPLQYADDITMPMLLIHSEQDWRCPIEQAQRLFVALRLRGVEAEMLIFPGEGHELSRSGRPRHRQQRFDAILDWWARHLPVG